MQVVWAPCRDSVPAVSPGAQRQANRDSGFLQVSPLGPLPFVSESQWNPSYSGRALALLCRLSEQWEGIRAVLLEMPGYYPLQCRDGPDFTHTPGSKTILSIDHCRAHQMRSLINSRWAHLQCSRFNCLVSSVRFFLSSAPLIISAARMGGVKNTGSF